MAGDDDEDRDEDGGEDRSAAGEEPAGAGPDDPPRPPAAVEPTITLLEALFAQASAGFAFYDTQGRYLRVNDVLARLNGRAPSEHVGRTMPELLGDVGHEMDRLLRRVLTTGEPVANFEVSAATTAAGPPRIWTMSWFPATDAHGVLLGAALVATDVTRISDARHQLARGEARYRALAQAGDTDVFHAGARGALDVDMPRWRAVTGQSFPEIAGAGWLGGVHTEDRDRVADAWRKAVEQRTVFDAEFRLDAADGTERVLVMRIVPITEGDYPLEWIGVSRDVTEIRAAAAARDAPAVDGPNTADTTTGVTGTTAGAAEQTEQIRLVTAALSRAVSIDEVTAVVLDAGRQVLGANGRGIALVDEVDNCLRFRSLLGYPALLAQAWSGISLEASHPVAEAVRGASPLFLLDREELTARWPAPEQAAILAEADEHAWAILPLATVDAPFGVLLFGFRARQAFSAADRAYLTALADQCARALERATLFERVLAEARSSRRAEETARTAAAAAREAGRRLELLARATGAVGSALEPERALRALTDVVVGELADSCAVYLVESGPDRPDLPVRTDGPDGLGGAPAAGPAEAPVLRRAVVSVRPGLTQLPMPRARTGRWPRDSPVHLAALTGRGHIAPLAGAPWLSSTDMARWMQHVGAHTLAAVPLILRGQVAGVVSLMAAGDRPPYTQADVAFLEELAARAAVAVEHAELYRRSRDTALTLQRSLLPPTVVEPEGLEIAARYVPGVEDTEVGGDWFDVIDLGAGRVGLVIGDVMGRGVRAAAIMGQLRTAVRTCARLELSPYEVLTLLDGVVSEIDEGQIATCIYGVIEPHTGLLTLANAGHPPPLVVAPDGLVSRLYMEVGTPLGLGRGDVKEYTVRLQRGALLVLFTDGLVESRERDIDAGVSDLAAVLARQDGSLGRRADQALEALGRDVGHDDDVALLLVGLPDTDAGGATRYADITIPDGPAGLGAARGRACDLLTTWSVDADTADSVVLLMSELVTNALVHGRSPLSVRLRRTGSRVIVEVSDRDPRLPRRRHADFDDEGGRGLELVSLIASRWGTRSVGDGKVVWAEIAAPPLETG
ncbi:putative PAS/PAC sensor protein [Candidatus Protofrankia datiscae]|uniref:protein-serine/threonine phosphatase n=1 Tax=Candidatus Protofrankia datiscae TaxID=2716812 RepID=F8B373_9ACTN|nr:putative PAS/PAC sensor protein [Candidatus Protofrankia datiscae]